MRSPGTTARAAPFGLGPDRAGYVGYPVEETKPDWAYEYLLGKLGEVEDPELGMDIVELGVFYDAEIEGPKVKVTYTLTSMGCPAGAMIQEDIERVLTRIPDVEEVESELTFDPPWTPDKMSDDAKFILGFG